MPITLSPLIRPIATCGLMFALSGCAAAVPLAHFAAPATQPNQACAAGSGCDTPTTGMSFTDLDKQLDTRMQAFTGTQTYEPPTQAAAPAK